MDKLVKHPYIGLPKYQFWKRSFGDDFIHGLDPVSAVKFKFNLDTNIVAAGSCFAQHVARHIKKRGYNFLVTENSHEIFTKTSFDDAFDETFNYGYFSSRYGNIYTARQLRQLIDRAYGRFVPIVDHWSRSDGRLVDPFRPQVEPGGFVSVSEVKNDRRQHLSATREAIEKADIFIFTLGLTEAWQDCRDGAVYPVAPGVSGGEYDPEIHKFINFDVYSVLEDMIYCIDAILERNINIKILLTVSPVPLNATYEPRHVLQSTVYSKSVLRVVAQMLADKYDFVDYFPSYEIITSPQCCGHYFAEDMRSVTEQGVEHVMDVFFSHYADSPSNSELSGSVKISPKQNHSQEMEKLVRVLCDEEMIDSK